MKCAILVAEKLAAQSPLETSFAIGKDLKTGELYAEEYGKQIKGQLSINDVQHVVDEMEVDHETGEILNEQAGNVIDLRKVATN